MFQRLLHFRIKDVSLISYLYGDIDFRVDGPVETMARVESVQDWVEAMTKHTAEYMFILDTWHKEVDVCLHKNKD